MDTKVTRVIIILWFLALLLIAMFCIGCETASKRDKASLASVDMMNVCRLWGGESTFYELDGTAIYTCTWKKEGK
jgi:hypothetical protein